MIPLQKSACVPDKYARPLSLLLLLVIAVTACKTPVFREKATMEDPDLVRVECRNENTVKQIVLQHLRLIKFSDITIRNDGSSLEIEAAYQDAPMWKLQDIEHRVREVAGVTRVEIKKALVPVKNTFQ